MYSNRGVRVVAAVGIFLGCSLKNLNYTKSNKIISWIFATKPKNCCDFKAKKKYNCHYHQGELTTTIFFLKPFFKEKWN